MGLVLDLKVLEICISNYEFDQNNFKPTDQTCYCKELRRFTVDNLRLGIAQYLLNEDISLLKSAFVTSREIRQKLENEIAEKPEFARYTLLSDYLPMVAQFCIDEDSHGFIDHPYHEGSEYEEDYLYGLFFFKYFSQNTMAFAKDIIFKLISLDEESEPRYLLIEALLKKNSQKFYTALLLYLEHQNVRLERLRKKGAEKDPHYFLDKEVDIELWAWIKIGKREGLDILPKIRDLLSPQMVKLVESEL